MKLPFNKKYIHANRTDKDTAEAIIEFSLDIPHLGQVQVSSHLKQSNHIDISASGVRQVWLCENMQTIALRKQKRSEMQELLGDLIDFCIGLSSVRVNSHARFLGARRLVTVAVYPIQSSNYPN